MDHAKIDVEAVIFDLDGTLLDSMQIYYEIVEIVLERLGFPQVSRGAMREAVKDGDFDWLKILPDRVRFQKKETMVNIRKVIDEVYPGMFQKEVRPISGTSTVVKWLAARGFKLGIVTSTPRNNVDFKLHQLQKTDTLMLFEVIITSDDTTKKKPAPDPMIKCCKELNVKPENCVYLGDSRTDIRSAKRANMKAVGVLTGFDDYETLKLEGPDFIIDSVADLRDIILV